MKKFFSKLFQQVKQPKWRHGRLSALVMAGLVAIAVLLNVAIRSLEDEYGWRKDYSFNRYATTGQETQAVVDRLSSPVEIYLLEGGTLDGELIELLNRYDVLSDKITIVYTSIAKNPGILNQFPGDVNTALTAGNIVVSCKATGRYKILNYLDFSIQEYSIEQGVFEIAGKAYEKKLTEALVYVTEAAIPMVGVLQGHGEYTLEQLASLVDFLQSNNYDTCSVNLLSGGSLEDIDLLLIGSPQKDFTQDEVSKINAFAQGGGSLLVTRDYTDPMALANYFSLLRNYGVTPLNGVVVANAEDTESYYGESIYLLPYMDQVDFTLPLISGQMDILLLAGASAFETPADPDSALTVETVLKSGERAYLRDPSDGNATIDQQPGDRTGELSLALYAKRMHSTGDVSRLFAIGNSTLFTDEYLYQITYNKEFILQLMGELLPQKAISLDIMASAAYRPGLTPRSQTLGIALMVAVPLLILAAALCILLPRRNR